MFFCLFLLLLLLLFVIFAFVCFLLVCWWVLDFFSCMFVLGGGGSVSFSFFFVCLFGCCCFVFCLFVCLFVCFADVVWFFVCLFVVYFNLPSQFSRCVPLQKGHLFEVDVNVVQPFVEQVSYPLGHLLQHIGMNRDYLSKHPADERVFQTAAPKVG